MGQHDRVLQLAKCSTLAEVDELYRPYRPKRRTRASEALDRGIGGPAAQPVWCAAVRHCTAPRSLNSILPPAAPPPGPAACCLPHRRESRRRRTPGRVRCSVLTHSLTGLAALADAIVACAVSGERTDRRQLLKRSMRDAMEPGEAGRAFDGARDILAERAADDADLRHACASKVRGLSVVAASSASARPARLKQLQRRTKMCLATLRSRRALRHPKLPNLARGDGGPRQVWASAVVDCQWTPEATAAKGASADGRKFEQYV